MNPPGLSFHHLGLAVRRPEDAIRFLGGLGYEIGEPVFDPEQASNLIMCRHAGAMPDTEIIYPGKIKSAVDALVTLRPEGIVYHVCYETPDLAAALAAIEASGIRAICVAPPKPAVLFGGRKVSFYNIVGMGLCEILESGDR